MTVPAPEDPDEELGPVPLFSPAFWIVLAFAVACILAGAWVGVMGPRVFKAHPPTAPFNSSGIRSKTALPSHGPP